MPCGAEAAADTEVAGVRDVERRQRDPVGALAAHLCQSAVADVLGPGEIAILLSLLFIAM